MSTHTTMSSRVMSTAVSAKSVGVGSQRMTFGCWRRTASSPGRRSRCKLTNCQPVLRNSGARHAVGPARGAHQARREIRDGGRDAFETGPQRTRQAHARAMQIEARALVAARESSKCASAKSGRSAIALRSSGCRASRRSACFASRFSPDRPAPHPAHLAAGHLLRLVRPRRLRAASMRSVIVFRGLTPKRAPAHCSEQLRWQAWSWVEQFCWHCPGLDVVPTVVIDGTTVAPVTVLMQVF